MRVPLALAVAALLVLPAANASAKLTDKVSETAVTFPVSNKAGKSDKLSALVPTHQRNSLR
jgi:hypothetical protein